MSHCRSPLSRILEESFPGYMANNLIWCGDPDSPDGLNYDQCPSSFDCPNGSYAFWKAASREVNLFPLKIMFPLLAQ